MRLLGILVNRYRSLRGAEIAVGGINLLIGANGAGKSTVLDALRFLSEAVQQRDFKGRCPRVAA